MICGPACSWNQKERVSFYADKKTVHEPRRTGMREIHVREIADSVRDLCIRANTVIDEATIQAYREALPKETSPIGANILRQMIENAEIAREKGVAVCQDTGMVVVFIDIGQDVHIIGGDLTEALNEGVRRGYGEGCFRASTLDPLTRKNFGDNTPAVIHMEIVTGDRIKLSVLPKGFGGEMMSQARVFHPAAGIEAVKAFVVERVAQSGGKPCPPGIIGVGIGGTLEKAAIIAKKSLLRPVGRHHEDPMIASLENELLNAVNRLGIGPQGLGGRVTALAVHVETYPTHIASFPVAVNIQCHSIRHCSALL
jgi:fumarate hydratase subunit alpha